MKQPYSMSPFLQTLCNIFSCVQLQGKLCTKRAVPRNPYEKAFLVQCKP